MIWIWIHNKPELSVSSLWASFVSCKEKSHRSSCVPLSLQQRPYISIKSHCSKQTSVLLFCPIFGHFLVILLVTRLFSPCRFFICCNVSATCRFCRSDCSPSPSPAITSHNKQPRGCWWLCCVAFRRVSTRWRLCRPAPCRKPVLMAFSHCMWRALKRTTKTHSLLAPPPSFPHPAEPVNALRCNMVRGRDWCRVQMKWGNGNGMMGWIWKKEQRQHLVIDTGFWVGGGGASWWL